jgi:hypothetical protein
MTRDFSRWASYGALALVGIYVALVVGPFIGYGLYQQPAPAIIGGAYDPKNLALFATAQGQVLYILGTLALVLLPWLGGLLALVSLVALARGWRTLAARGRTLGVAALLAWGSALLFMASPAGRLISTWWAD